MTREEALNLIQHKLDLAVEDPLIMTDTEYEVFTLCAKALKQEPCDDWYDVPSDEMTLEQARRAVRDLRGKLAECLEQEPCEDAISRQAVEKITWEEPSYTDALNVLTEVRDKVRALPSVNPQEPVLDKIRAEIDDATEIHSDGEFYIKNIDVKRIIDKYKTESEE